MKRKKSIYIRTMAVAAFAVLSACSGGGGSTPGSPATGVNSIVYAVSNPAPASTCPNGGITVDAGIDANGNAVLDPSEVTSTQYVCNGANGSNGLSTLMLISDEAAGANCAAGGKKVDAGLDANGNGVLDSAEVSSTAYICNGANGTNGANSLVSIVPEPAGIYCTYGGNKVSSGVDGNNNGVLDAAEISVSNYVCDGAPGPGITWVDVTGPSIQAESNKGYLADNAASQVTITLPAAPAVGDIVQVTGLGIGGWKVAQNAGQSIMTGNVMGNIGSAWMPRDSVRQWYAVASSADGSKLVAAVSAGQLYTSTDTGITWTPQETARQWMSVASSADGSNLVAAVQNGQLYTSTDSGVTWTPRETARQWMSVASSADGSKFVAAAFNDQLYTSTDSGVTWTPRETTRKWQAVASSADGTKLVAADYGYPVGGYLYTSIDSGLTWTPRASARLWMAIASSADGSKLVAATFNDQLYISTDFGLTWTARETARSWSAVASSADGTKFVAADSTGGQLYTSIDSGVTWAVRSSLTGGWSSVASSADGNKLVAADSGGQLYTSIPTAIAGTSIGTAGSISGVQYDAVDLQYLGNNTFTVRGHEGFLVVQ